MEQLVRTLFERYEALFNRSLTGAIDRAEFAALYAPAFISATPAGVMTGKNDDGFLEAMVQGYEHCRAIGTRAMRIRSLRLSPIDEMHCVAHVGWTATYARGDLPETSTDFDVHYLVQLLDGAAEVFCWVSGDEEAVLKQHGIV